MPADGFIGYCTVQFLKNNKTNFSKFNPILHGSGDRVAGTGGG
jgi:hypothetical protein